MAIVLTNDDNYKNIANSIREKLGTSDSYTPSEMSEAIKSIEGSNFNFGDGLVYDEETKTVSVDTTDSVEQDNTKPITSAGVYTELGNINILLSQI